MAMTKSMVETGATFEDTYPRFPFAPLVALALMLASWIQAARKPASRHGAGPVYQLRTEIKALGQGARFAEGNQTAAILVP